MAPLVEGLNLCQVGSCLGLFLNLAPWLRSLVRRVPGLGAEEAAEAVRLHEQGLSLRAIAKVMGISRRHVTQAVHDACALTSLAGGSRQSCDDAKFSAPVRVF